MPGNFPTIPLSVIAKWPKPNYVDPDEITWMPVFAGTWQAVATLLFATRITLRACGKAGGFGLDDLLLALAFLAGTAFTAICILSTERYEVGRHVWDVEFDKFEKIVLAGWASQIAFLVSTSCTKISVLLFYRRLTKGDCRTIWKVLVIGAIILTAMYCVGFVLTLVFACQPTEAYWRTYNFKYTGEHRCIDTRALNPISGALSIVSDFYAVLLPMAIMWGLKATKRQKWALNAVFSLGLLVVGAGVVRTYYFRPSNTDWDLTRVGFKVFVWSQLELQLAIICASAPALRVLVRRYLNYSSRVLDSNATSSFGDTAPMASRIHKNDDSQSSGRRGSVESGMDHARRYSDVYSRTVV